MPAAATDSRSRAPPPETPPLAVASSNSACSSSVITSSDGCLARHSMYSAKTPVWLSTRRACMSAGGGSTLFPSLSPCRFGRGSLPGPAPESQQHPDRPHRHLRSEVGDEVESAAPDQVVEAASAELTHLGFERRDFPWRENACHQPAVEIVPRRIVGDDRAGRDLHPGLDQSRARSPWRSCIPPVLRAALDVVETAQREEVVLLVVVQRLLVRIRFQIGYGSLSISKSYGS